MLEPFSTPAVPYVVETVDDQMILEVFDPDRSVPGPVDLFTGPFREDGIVHPSHTAQPVWNDTVILGIPSRHLLKDVYLEKRLAMASIPSVGVYLLGIQGILQGLPRARWYDRIPGTPALRVLGQGIAQSVSDVFPRHPELTARLFELSGWNPNDFVGYRCEVHYPIWQAQYVTSFEFEKVANAPQ